MESIARCTIYISVCKYFIILPYIVSTDSSNRKQKTIKRRRISLQQNSHCNQKQFVKHLRFHLLSNFGGISNRIVVLITNEVTASRSNQFKFICLFMILHTISHILKSISLAFLVVLLFNLLNIISIIKQQYYFYLVHRFIILIFAIHGLPYDSLKVV